MKKIIISIVMCAALASCTKNESTETNEPREIYFGTKMTSTKAVIDSKDDKPATEVSGIQILRLDGTSVDWATATSVETTGIIAADGNALTIAKPQFMNANKENANFMAYYPAGAAAPASDRVEFTIKGTEDLLVAPSVAATYDAPACAFAFAHKLTQVELIVVAADAATATLFGNLTAASINTDSKVALKLSDGTVTVASGSPKIDFQFYKGETAFTSTAVTVAPGLTVGQTMIPAGELTAISMTFANRPTAVSYQLTKPLTLVAGSKHVITATITAKEVGFSSKIAAWNAGASGDIQL